MNRRLTVGLGVIVALGLFQLFLRYQYVPERNDVVMRIDRVTGSSCAMPCMPTPPPPPTPTQTPFDQLAAQIAFSEQYHLLQQRAIRAAKATTIAQEVVQQHPEVKYLWSAYNMFDDLLNNATPGPNAAPGQSSEPTPDPLIDVCYCDKQHSGWHWEVHTDTGEVFYTNDQRY